MATEYRFPAGRLMVFAKAPVAGSVKTRLIPLLGVQGATRFYARICGYCIALAVRAGVAPVQLYCDPDAAHPFFAQLAHQYGPELRRQEGEGLGERMHQAFESALAQAKYGVLIGSDLPGLSTALLQEAFSALEDGCDAVIAPAEDGGYVLLGLRVSSAALFNDMVWSRGDVFAETCRRMDGLGWDYRVLEKQWDVDWPQDWYRLRHEGLLANQK